MSRRDSRSEWQAGQEMKLEPMQEAPSAQPAMPPVSRFTLKVGAVIKAGAAVLVLAGLWSAGIIQMAFQLTMQAFFGGAA